MGCRILATECRMPLDAPMNASQGWDIVTLRSGYRSLELKYQSMLSLFCRVYSLQLFVSDDIAFYQAPLGPPRAMVTALNSLLYSESCNPSPKGDLH